MVGMLLPEALRHERFQRVAQEFFSAVPKQFLGLRVGEDDRARVIHDQYRVRRRF